MSIGIPPHGYVSATALHRAAETAMVAAYAEACGRGPLRPGQVRLPGASTVHVPGVSVDGSLVVAACPVVSALGGDDLPAVIRGIFTLTLLRSAHPDTDVVLLFAGEAARDSARAWATSGHPRHPVRLEVADLGEMWRVRLTAAEVRRRSRGERFAS